MACCDGCSRIVTRGTNAFQRGQVDVSMSAFQTAVDESRSSPTMEVALCRWTTASLSEILGVEWAILLSGRIINSGHGVDSGILLTKTSPPAISHRQALQKQADDCHTAYFIAIFSPLTFHVMPYYWPRSPLGVAEAGIAFPTIQPDWQTHALALISTQVLSIPHIGSSSVGESQPPRSKASTAAVGTRAGPRA